MKSAFAKLIYAVALLLLAAYPTLAFSPAAPARHAADLPVIVYLPVVTRPAAALQGRVTLNGSPLSGAPLELRFYNGSVWSTFASLATGADGRYRFEGVPSLTAGQRYYVRYRNTAETPGRLWLWGTRELTSYTAGADVLFADFDLADVIYLAPAAGDLVSLPYTFRWARRPATPSDSYEFDLYDYDDGDPFFYTDPLLGYADSFTLNSLPPGFNTYTPYVWDIWIYSPDGGYGISYWAYYVGFSNAGQAAVSAAPLAAPPARPIDDLPPRPPVR